MATQQIVTPVGQQQKSAVVPFPNQSPQTITQIELALFLSMRGRLQQLEEHVAAAQEEFKARLEAGAAVQPGDHVARLDERARRNVAWRGVAENLADIILGDGKGVPYCDEVLNATAPTITIALVVR
jgi:hypothetical protein